LEILREQRTVERDRQRLLACSKLLLMSIVRPQANIETTVIGFFSWRPDAVPLPTDAASDPDANRMP
jgi:hypothetical protein